MATKRTSAKAADKPADNSTVEDGLQAPGSDVPAGQEAEKPAEEPPLERLYRATMSFAHAHWGDVLDGSLWRLNPNHEHTTGALAAGLIQEVPDADQGSPGA